jgi:hypothetical protein
MQARLYISRLVGLLVDDITAGVATLVRNVKKSYHTIKQSHP